MTNALFASGGVREIGSLRKIRLMRGGKLVRQLDLYDMLLRGDTSGDARLLPGDVIFIPPVGATVTASGEVRRPAIYELKDGDTAAELLRLAGGLTPEADARTARIERVADQRERMAMTLDLSGGPGPRSARLQSGDVVQVDAIRDRLEGLGRADGPCAPCGPRAVPAGHATHGPHRQHRRAPAARRHALRADPPRDRADATRFGAVGESRRGVRGARFGRERDAAVPRHGLRVRPRDEPGARRSTRCSRNSIARATRDMPQQLVTISGRVKVPGDYPLEPGMTISDLLRAGGGLDQAAFTGQAELTRHQVTGGRGARRS